MNRAPRQASQPQLRNFALLAIVLSVLVVTGCAGVPSKMYTTKDPATTMVSGKEPTPCDTFTYGEHPIVVVEGFQNVHEATLEILTNGTVIHRKTIPLHSDQAPESFFTPETTQSGITGQYVQRDHLHVVVNAGAKIDLGVVAAGTYDLNLKTNDIIAAATRFTVVLPARLQALHDEIESERLKLELLVDQIKKLSGEIERDRAALDTTKQSMVEAFNAKIARHNKLVDQAKAARDQFNSKVQLYNNDLKGQQDLIPPF